MYCTYKVSSDILREFSPYAEEIVVDCYFRLCRDNLNNDTYSAFVKHLRKSYNKLGALSRMYRLTEGL